MDKQKLLNELESIKYLEILAPKNKAKYLIGVFIFALLGASLKEAWFLIFVGFALLFLALRYDLISKTYAHKPISKAYAYLCAGLDEEAKFWLYFLSKNNADKQAKRLWQAYNLKEEQWFEKALKLYKSRNLNTEAYLQRFDNQLFDLAEKFCKTKDQKSLEEIKRIFEEKQKYIAER